MTYNLCRKVIENNIARGTLNKNEMRLKLDTFLLAGRITESEYTELAEMVNKAA